MSDEPGADGPDAHVVFELDVQDGWPPVASERVWAYDRGDDTYVIDNPPWFVRDLAVGDVVRAMSPYAASQPVFQQLMRRSDHVTIRLACFRSGPPAGDLARAIEPFRRLGVYAEGAGQYGMVALDIAPTDPMAEIVDVLRAGVADGSWEFEEGRVTEAWRDVRLPSSRGGSPDRLLHQLGERPHLPGPRDRGRILRQACFWGMDPALVEHQAHVVVRAYVPPSTGGLAPSRREFVPAPAHPWGDHKPRARA